MNILVFVKEVLDSSVPLEIREAEGTVVQREPEAIYVLGPADRAAVEQAIRLREAAGGGSVVVATLGPDRADWSLRLALARGADRAIHICDLAAEGSDALATAFILSRVARLVPADLILCGNGSLDTGTAAVPAMLAEFLGLSQITGVVALAVENGSIRAQRRLERGNRQVVTSPLPAVVAVEAGIAEPRYVSIRALMAAQQRTVERRTLADLGIAPTEVGAEAAGIQVARLAAPRPRPKKIWTPDATMSAADRLKFLMGGGAQKKPASGASSNFIEGPAEVVAGHIVDYLKKEKLI